MYRGIQHTGLYRAYRPAYPQSLIGLITNFVNNNGQQQLSRHYPDTTNTSTEFSHCKFAVDVGCGSGQLTKLLAQQYENVLGIDESSSQIDRARSSENPPSANITYEVALAEDMPVESGTVDLVTAAQCVHWMDENKFYAEVKRVLKPNSGCLAVIWYRHPVIQHNIDTIKSRLLTEISEECFVYFRDHKYMDERSVKVEYYPEQFKVPFSNSIRVSNLNMVKSCSLANYIGYISSTVCYENYKKANPSDDQFLLKLLYKMQKVIMDDVTDPNDSTLILHFPLDVILAQPD